MRNRHDLILPRSAAAATCTFTHQWTSGENVAGSYSGTWPNLPLPSMPITSQFYAAIVPRFIPLGPHTPGYTAGVRITAQEYSIVNDTLQITALVTTEQVIMELTKTTADDWAANADLTNYYWFYTTDGTTYDQTLTPDGLYRPSDYPAAMSDFTIPTESVPFYNRETGTITARVAHLERYFDGIAFGAALPPQSGVLYKFGCAYKPAIANIPKGHMGAWHDTATGNIVIYYRSSAGTLYSASYDTSLGGTDYFSGEVGFYPSEGPGLASLLVDYDSDTGNYRVGLWCNRSSTVGGASNSDGFVDLATLTP